jgi:hypothetical protein
MSTTKNLSQEDAKVICKKMANSYKLVTKPGKYNLVAGFSNSFTRDNGDDIHICNIKGFTSYGVEQFKLNCQKGDYVAASKCGITATIWDGVLPINGEIVVVNMGHITTKSGEQALMPTNVIITAPVEAKAVNLSDLFDEDSNAIAGAKLAEVEEVDIMNELKK